jgi:hypothetical protein
VWGPAVSGSVRTCACGLKALPTGRCPKTPPSPRLTRTRPDRAITRVRAAPTAGRCLAAIPTVSARSHHRLRSVSRAAALYDANCVPLLARPPWLLGLKPRPVRSHHAVQGHCRVRVPTAAFTAFSPCRCPGSPSLPSQPRCRRVPSPPKVSLYMFYFIIFTLCT